MRLFAFLLLLGIALAAAVAADAWRAWQQPLGHAPGEIVELPAGSSWHHAVYRMQGEGWLRHARDVHYLKLLGRLDARTRRLQAGEYALPAGLDVQGFIDLLVSGRVVQHRVTFVEGWRLQDALAALWAHDAVRRTLPDAIDDAIAALRAHLNIAADNPEGWLLPDTYQFTRGDSDLAILARAHTAMQDALEQAWAERAEDLPLATPEELLVLASIVEKETGAEAERARVAGVFARRLRIGMRLQTDPTVIYGLGPDFEGRLRRVHLDTDTPYNTYTRQGLPPTPIALPGRAALDAAARPAQGSALYFVSRNDGTHQFSDTLSEHSAAVRRYQLGERN